MELSHFSASSGAVTELGTYMTGIPSLSFGAAGFDLSRVDPVVAQGLLDFQRVSSSPRNGLHGKGPA
jgi:hypothetical protein